MSEYKDIVGFLSGIIAFSAYGLYVREIFYAGVKPHAFSWLIWALLDGIAFAAQVTGNAGPGSWALGISSFMCACIFLIALVKGEKNYRTADWIALLLGLFSLLLWKITADSTLSLFLIVLINLFGCFPTLRKSFTKPFQESITLFSLAWIKSVLSLFALDAYSIATAFYPAASVTINSTFVLVLFIRRKQVRT